MVAPTALLIDGIIAWTILGNPANAAVRICAHKPSDLPVLCGDGRRHPREACDDGNNRGKDGCTDCTVDEGWACYDVAVHDGYVKSKCYRESQIESPINIQKNVTSAMQDSIWSRPVFLTFL
jgi:cysteine-rich repeat protein